MSTEIEKLLEERGKTHGLYEDFAYYVQSLKDFTARYCIENNKAMSFEHIEALDMIFHKIGRIIIGNPNVKDHWDDLAGYATLGSKSIKDDGSVSESKTPTAQAQCTSTGARTTDVSAQGTATQA